MYEKMAMASPTLTRQRLKISADSIDGSNKLLNENVLMWVFKATNWNPFMLGRSACVCKKLSGITKRVLWKEFCMSRAPRMVSDLLSGGRNGCIDGGWDTLAKMLFYCAGCHESSNFDIRTSPGHFICESRFSRTSGKSFLVPQCRADILYVTDPCEHLNKTDEDVGLFRGIFRSFENSRTRRLLIQKNVQLDEKETCPYCRARVWSMRSASMIPKSAARRLGAYEDNVEYFVCLHGHVNGQCLLLPLSDSEGPSDDEEG